MLAGALLTGCASVGQDSQPDSRFAWQSAEPVEIETPAQSAVDIEPTVVAYRDYKDPLIRVNRAIFAFNDVSYRYALIPVSKGYVKVVPRPVRQGVNNFFYNIKAPIYLINNSLQLKPKAAGVNLLRFGINSTIGLLGFFDPAKEWFSLEKADTDFGDTFAHYGAGYGFYIVLPILGPSDLRDGSSALLEGFFHPISYVADDPERTVIQGFGYFQEFAPLAERYQQLSEESDDPYVFFRNMYLQGVQRDAAYQN